MDSELRRSVQRLLEDVELTHVHTHGEPMPQWAVELKQALEAPAEVKVQLPEQVLIGIEAIAAAPLMEPRDKYTAIMIATMGGILFAEASFLDGTKLLIPEDQWLRISAACLVITKEEVDAVNYALSFMNSGPSTYKEETNEQTAQPDH